MKLRIFILTVFSFFFFGNSLVAQEIGDFVSVNPNGRDATFRLPDTHTFQKLIQEGDVMTGGASYQSKTDFTGYVPINGSSINGYLSINNEASTGGVAMLDINYDQNQKLWNVTYSQYVDFSAYGRTSRNCSGAVTPWGTILTSEEVQTNFNDINNDGYYDYGWQVEIDPISKQVIDKRWALGRFAHENAVVHKNWRTVYQGADESTGYLYKFVADFPADLSSGKLYVYKGSKTGGSGQWILIPNTTKSQRNNTKSYAQNVGATVFNGIEDVEIGPDGLVYFAVKSENKIYYFKDSDPISGTSVSFLNKFAGNRNYTINTVNGNVNYNWGYGNDNLAFDNEGNLWVLQDGENSHIWVVRKGHTETNPKVEIFATSPNGCEPTGITFSPDGRFIFLSIQHPNAFTWQTDAAGNSMRFNSDATLVIARKEHLGADCLGSCPDCADNIKNYRENGTDCGGSCENCPTCFDRVKNGNETGIDCGGNSCTNCPTLSITKTNVTCNNNDDGSAIASVTGGAGTITYLWSTGDTTARVENLSPGSYSLKIADSNGNQASRSITILEPSTLNITGTVSLPNTLNSSNGAVNISISGGQTPYSYNWSNNATSKNIASLSPGLYTVGVTDANGCTLYKTFNIELPSCTNFEVSVYSNNIDCANNTNGEATALVAGGTAPFSYNWSNGSVAKTIQNLAAGSYSVTVTDGNGCSATSSATIYAPANSLNVSLTANNTNEINSNTGSIIATVTGGQSPYLYNWSNGASSSTISNLNVGAYTLQVTDSRGCTFKKVANVNEYICPNITGVISTTDITCFGLNDGTAFTTRSGGTSPYFTKWSNGVIGAFNQNLSVGAHSVTISDSKGCSNTLDFEITEPTPINIQSTTVNATDTLNNNGSISVVASGGAGNYAYNWSVGNTITSVVDTFWLTTDTVKSLTDSIWFASDTIWFVNDSILLAGDTIWSTGNIISSLNDTIFTAVDTIRSIDGTIFSAKDTIWVSGDTLWSAIDTSWYVTDTVWSVTDTIKIIDNTFTTIDCLLNDDYSITVTDQNNCSATSNFKVQPHGCPNMSIQLSKNNVSCFGENTGSVTATVSGATPNITYVWSNGLVTSNTNSLQSSILNLQAGVYSLTATDGLGCEAFVETQILEPSNNLNVSLSVKNVSTLNGSDGESRATVNGGVAPYTYNWSNGDNTEITTNLSPGTYTLIVTDANSCSIIKNFTINNFDCSNMEILLSGENTGCFGAAETNIIASVTNATSPISYSWSNNATTPFLSNLSTTGSFSLSATDAKGCSTTKNVSISNNPTLQVSDNVTNLSGYNTNDGFINTNTSGGTNPFSYYWGNSATTTSISNLTAGVYDFLAVDDIGCSVLETNTVDNYVCDYEVLALVTQTSCRNGNDGSITLTATGGLPPYDYDWADIIQNTSIRNNLSDGIYTATITDNRNCEVEVKAIVEEPSSSFSINVSATNESYFNASNGTATATAIGGVQPITYDWSTGLGNATINNLSAGSYNVKAIDANGCLSNTRNFTINGISCNNTSLSVNKTDVDCFEAANGTATAIATGVVAPYSISWLYGNVGTSVSFLDVATNYETHVVDAVGCEANATFTINEPTELIFSSSKTNITYYNAQNGTASVSVTGGTSPYTYSWSNGSAASTVSNLSAGQYTVDITDANNCTQTETFIIENVDCRNIDISSVNKKNITCRTNTDGEIAVIVTGGNAPFSYAWSNGSTQSQITNLAAGSYSLNITDAKGCTDARTIVLNNPAYFNVGLNTNNVTQGNVNDGSASLTITGGVLPYNINWSNGATTASVYNFSSGTHSYTVEDANGCTRSESFTLCTPPYNVEELSVFENSAVIGWDGDPGDNTYNYRYKNVTNGSFWLTGSTTNTFLLLNNLPSCKTYQFEVFGSCSSTNGTLLEFTTDGCSGCNATTNLYHLNVRDLSAFINWDLVPGSKYVLYYRKVGAQSWFSYEMSITYAILYGLDPCSSYEWYVDTKCSNGTVFHTNLKDSFTTLCLRENGVGENERIDNIELAVFPNPTKEYISLILNTAIDVIGKTAEINLYDISGKLIKQDNGVEQLYNYQLDVSDLTNGMYVIEVKMGDFIKEAKFIKE